MMLIDTHVLLWWVSQPEKLSQRAKEAIQKEKNEGTILISSISVWEIYMLVKKKRLQLGMDTDSWLAEIESLPYVQFVPVDNKLAAKSVLLPGTFHGDPADRMIVATAREKGIALITADDKIKKYHDAHVIW